MTVDVRPTVVIGRPRSEVAAFMFDPANDLLWTGGITASRPSRPGPLELGSTVERDAKFLGRPFTYGYQVTEYEPGRLVQMSVERPFPMVVRYELEDHERGTLTAIRATGSPGRFFRLLTPLLGRQVHRSVAADLGRLKEQLEPERQSAELSGGDVVPARRAARRSRRCPRAASA